MNKDIPMSIKMGPKSFKGIKDLAEGIKTDETPIHELCEFIDYRLDCSDFRMMTILKVLNEYQELLSEDTITRMKKTVLDFKYWMDEPGDDSMCYWSENHQILFFTSAYLAGTLYPDMNFNNSGLKGLELTERFRPRILAWLEYRFEHGFIEWHSNTYYEEDLAPLVMLVDYADEEISLKASMIMDLMIADIAMHLHKGVFSVTSGRCYEEQKKHPLKQDTLGVIEYLFGQKHLDELDYSRITSVLYLTNKYELPEVIKQIANDESNHIVKTSMGHNVSDIKDLINDKGLETGSYVQWAMESFTNPETIKNTLRMYRKFNMKSNDFLKDFKMLDYKFADPFLPQISKVLNPMIDGVAIQKINSYTYHAKDYMLSTAQHYHPQTFGDQQHIWQATINEKLSIFTTHPGAAAFDDNARNFSPSYWVGNGIHPHSVQHENIHLSIYNLNKRKGFMEAERQLFTHAYFPQTEFDQVIHDGKYLFGRVGNVNCALIGTESLIVENETTFDIIQKGKRTCWMFEITNDESFDDFMSRVKEKNITFNGVTLTYGNLSLKFKGDFKVNHNVINTNYKRLESPYCTQSRCDEEIIYEYLNHKLVLNYKDGIREVTTSEVNE